jgi:predicted anti-sigma-YlaC factor YlaD
MGAVLSMECEHARRRASLELDGELSQVEQALLRAHLGRCTACAAFAGDVDALTREIRTTPHVRPLRAVLPARRRSAGRRVLQLGAAAAAVAIAAALGSLAGSLSSPDASGQRTSHRIVRVASLSTIATARPGSRLQQRIAL